jgi:hypothetical protein
MFLLHIDSPFRWPVSCGANYEVRPLIGLQISQMKDTSMIKGGFLTTAILAFSAAFGGAALAGCRSRPMPMARSTMSRQKL